METKQLLDTELDEARKLQDEKDKILFRLGEITAAKMLLDKEQAKVNEFYLSLEEENTRFLNGLTAKYGLGRISLETGVFTPDN